MIKNSIKTNKQDDGWEGNLNQVYIILIFLNYKMIRNAIKTNKQDVNEHINI